MFMRMLAVIGCGAVCALLADEEPKQKVQMSKTERVDFPRDGTLTMRNSIGELTIDGWDQPDVEITTIKSTKNVYSSAAREKASHDLDAVQIAAERHGDELIITTEFPRHGGFPFGRATNFDLDYYVKVPRNARLMVDHDVGDVHFDDVTGDVHATVLQGGITLRLPGADQYAIDAKSDLGNVISDFPGSAKRRFWLIGHTLNQSSAAPHKLYLRSGFGDIIILKIRQPATPPPVGQ